MSKCKNCKITILDPTDRCPLCHCVVEKEAGEEEPKAMYPNASVVTRKYRVLERAVLFLSVVAIAGLLLANYYVEEKFWAWTVVICLILLYVNMLLRLAITGKSGYLFKTLFMTFVTILVLVSIDALTGYHGWAVNYALPAAALFLDVGTVVLMFVNRRNWQSYLMVQIISMAYCAVLGILALVNVITDSSVLVVAATVSVVLFLGTLIVGGRRAQNELKRRFYI